MVDENYRKKEAERAKLYRIRKKDEINARDRKRWVKRRYVRRARTVGDKKCAFCHILLASTFVAMKHRRYCDTCLSNSDIRRIIRSLYMKRWYHKKNGLSTVQIDFPLYAEESNEDIQEPLLGMGKG